MMYTATSIPEHAGALTTPNATPLNSFIWLLRFLLCPPVSVHQMFSLPLHRERCFPQPGSDILDFMDLTFFPAIFHISQITVNNKTKVKQQHLRSMTW